MRRPFYPLILLYFCSSNILAATCFFPNGTTVPDASYQPCKPDDSASMCCRINAPNSPDTCRDDGLCLSGFDNNIWRESCTDHSWRSPKCIKLCPNGIGKRLQYPAPRRPVVEKVTLDFCVKGHYIEGDAGQYLNNVDTTVTPCGDDSYCCGNGTIGNTCCDFKEGVFLLNGETVLTRPPAPKTSTPPASSIPAAATHSSSSLTLSSTPITTSSSSPGSSSSPLGSTIPASSLPLSTSPANSFPSSKPSSLSRNTPIIIGVVLGTALVSVAGILLFFLRRYRKRLNANPAQVRSGNAVNELPGHDGAKEMDARGAHRELGVGQHVLELQGNSNFKR